MPPKKQKPRRAPDYAIQQRKKIDAEVRMRLEHQKDTFKANSVAKWAEDQFRKANLKGITPEQQKMREDERPTNEPNSTPMPTPSCGPFHRL